MALAVFRCDASPSIGAGHAMRCLATAETLAWASWGVEFVSAAGTVEAAPAIGYAGIPIRPATPGNLVGANLVVFDHYGIDAAEEGRMAGDLPVRVAFDDAPSRQHDVDILIDPTPERIAADYRQRVRNDTLVLAGVSYAQLRRSWRAQRVAALARRKEVGPARRILVSMGATDPGNATIKVLAALAATNLDLDVDVVLGAGAPHSRAVKAAMGDRGRLHVNPTDLPRLVADADIAVGAAGSSCFERACLGLPSIIVVLADNQVELSKAFAKAGAARVVTGADLQEPAALGRIIAELVENDEGRVAMTVAGAKLADGRGALRFLLALAGGQQTGSHTVTLRLAEAFDSDWLLALQSRPETRRFALNPQVPSKTEHAAWYERAMENPDRLLAIVVCDGVSGGMIRIDRSASKEASFEVSIAIAPELHGRGLGGATLSLLRQVVPSADLIASVLPENHASRSLFTRAGYCKESETRYRSRAS